MKAKYAASCDDNYNPDGLAALFTEDAVWESEGFGRFEGRAAIREFFRGASQIFSLAIHYSLNSQIEVTGDTAQAQWYLFMPCTLASDNQALWRASIDKEWYVRQDGEWMFQHKSSAAIFQSPFDADGQKHDLYNIFRSSADYYTSMADYVYVSSAVVRTEWLTHET